ncbi:hypothetical protein LZ31DRAFT_552389 [Colletotrichum somersetense]|nr:hypothetical protein LZ31DRAFT_552389 [Colletotrichum somersetense]
MRFSSYLSAAALSATAAIAAPYAWSITNWSAGPNFGSFQVSAPAAEHNGVSIPPFSLTAPCKVEGDSDASSDCSSLIENNTDGRTFSVEVITFDPISSTMTIGGTLGFKNGQASHTLETWVTGKQDGPTSFSAAGFSLDGDNGQNITTS